MTAERRVAVELEALVRASKIPGIEYVVVTPERILIDYAGGWADIGGRRPMTPATTMMAYSMSKTITAAAVLQLVEAGRIDLDEPVDRYLEWQPYGPGITVRGLLSHTAGLPNPIPLRWVHPIDRHESFDERRELATILEKHHRAATTPGTRYRYSNIGYWLLGPIVERVTGAPFAAHVADHVLRSVGVTPDQMAYTIPNEARHASGYLEKYSLFNLIKGFLVDAELIGGYEGRWVRIREHYLNGPAFGGLVGTAAAFARFLQDQLRPRSVLFGDATRQLFYAPERTRNGVVPMTLGWHVGVMAGTRFFFKEGGGGGFHCMMRLYPEAALGSVVMTNATGFDVRRLLDRLDRLMARRTRPE